MERAAEDLERFASPLRAAEHRFDVDDRSTVEGFDGADTKALSGDLPHSDPMQAQRVRPVRRSGRKDAGERKAPVRARVNLEDIAPGSIEPRDDDDFIAGRDSAQPSYQGRDHLEPRVRRPFAALLRRFGTRLEKGPDEADRTESELRSSVHGYLRCRRRGATGRSYGRSRPFRLFESDSPESACRSPQFSSPESSSSGAADRFFQRRVHGNFGMSVRAHQRWTPPALDEFLLDLPHPESLALLYPS